MDNTHPYAIFSSHHWAEEEISYSPLLSLLEIVGHASRLHLQWVVYSCLGVLEVIELPSTDLALGGYVNPCWFKHIFWVHYFNNITS